jgi:hypothetical protein
MLPTGQISFFDLRKTIGPNDTNSISLGQCRPSFPPAHGKGIIGVTDTNIAMSQFRGKSKLSKGFTFRAFQGALYTFSGGSGGAKGWATNGYRSCGGGGGGILVNGSGPRAGSGTGNAFVGGGQGGLGYGAGGGGTSWIVGTSARYSEASQPPGVGSVGFVYITLNGSEFFTTSSTTYRCNSSGTLKYLVMGDGGTWYAPDQNTPGNGANAGNLEYGTISVALNDILQITVGQFVDFNGINTWIVMNNTYYCVAGAGRGGVSYGGFVDIGNDGNGGNAGTGTMTLTNFNNALKYAVVERGGGYFADNISLFNTYTVTSSGTTTDMTNLTKATNSIYTTNGSSVNFSIEWVGKFYPPTTGSYTFYLNTDDASYFWIGSNATSGYTTANANINNGALHGMVNVSYTVALTGGTLYPIRIQYGQKEGGYDLQFSFTGPSISLTYNMDGYIYN